MKKVFKKEKVVTVLMIVLFIIMVFASSYAFFQYTRTGTSNIIQTMPLDFSFT